MKTAQEIFDISAVHLMTQGCRSITLSASCRYRGPGNKQCAIGPLIKDELYKVEIEGCPVEIMFQDYGKVMYACGLSRDDVGLLVTLQEVHDSTTVVLWLSALHKVAKDFELKSDVLSKWSKT